MPSGTITTATNNRINNANTKNNTVSDSKKLLKPSSTTRAITNNNTNSTNTNNSVKNTSRNLIPSSIDEESNKSEEYGNAYVAQKDVKEKSFERNYAYCWRFDVSWIERNKTLQK